MLTVNNFGYFFKESIDNLSSNKVTTFTTLVTMILSLLITGVFQAISINMVNVSNELGSSYEFNVYIKDTVEEELLESCAKLIENVEVEGEKYVKGISSPKTKSEAFEEAKQRVGEEQILRGLTEMENPFRASFIITVSDLSKAQEIIDEIKKIDVVDFVSNNVEQAKKIDEITGKIQLWSIVAYLLLAALCLSLIGNIINMSIFSRRKQINIMKYVGATDWFIKIPFIMEGILIGFIGAIVSSSILAYVYYLLLGDSMEIMQGIYLLKPLTVFEFVALINSLYGIIIGAIGAVFAVNKHLKV